MDEQNRESICEQIEEMLKASFKIDDSYLCQENRSKNLLSSPFNFDGIVLTYLFAEVEKNFQIRIAPEELDNYAFTTIHGIAEIVERHLRKKSKDC